MDSMIRIDTARLADAAAIAALRVRSNAARSESHRFYQSQSFAPVKTQHVYDLVLGTGTDA